MSPVARLSSPDRSAIGPIGAMRSSSLAYLPDGELGGRRERGASESNCCLPANLTSLATFFVQKQCKGLPFVAGKARSCLPFFARLPPGFELWARGLFSRLLCSVSAGGEGGGRRGGGEEEGGEQTEHQARTPFTSNNKIPLRSQHVYSYVACLVPGTIEGGMVCLPLLGIGGRRRSTAATAPRARYFTAELFQAITRFPTPSPSSLLSTHPPVCCCKPHNVGSRNWDVHVVNSAGCLLASGGGAAILTMIAVLRLLCYDRSRSVCTTSLAGVYQVLRI